MHIRWFCGVGVKNPEVDERMAADRIIYILGITLNHIFRKFRIQYERIVILRFTAGRFGGHDTLFETS